MSTFAPPASVNESAKTVVFVRGQGPALKSMIEESIRRIAYQKWEAAGKPDSDGICFWLDAEREFLQEESTQADNC
jgi:tRNA U34 2-thiouridine synthase MnmA/TrmU